MKILLAEDDLRLGKMLKTILSKNGINVKWVTNGESAYDECYADGYDVLVLDWMMPGMSGLRVCEELRKNSAVQRFAQRRLSGQNFNAYRARQLGRQGKRA